MKKLISLFATLCVSIMIYAVPSTTISVTSTAGDLSSAITTAGGNLSTVTNLTVTGTMDVRDFKTIRDNMPVLAVLDLSGVNITTYTGTGGTAGATSITYDANSIPFAAFESKSSLTSFAIPLSVTTIGDWAFSNCTGLTSITIPSSVTTIKYGAFVGCNNLDSIVIPSSVISIGDWAFESCYSLQTLSIPESVNSIGISAFYGCSGLTSVTLPSSITSIQDTTFSGCSALTSISIPKSVISIGSYAFDYCSNLLSISVYNPIPVDLSTSNNVFYNVNKTTCILHVPVGSASAYDGAVQWTDFINIVEDLPAAVFNTKSSNLKITTQNNKAILSGLPAGEVVSVYNLQGSIIYNQQVDTESITISLPAHGIYVLKVGGECVKILN